MGHIRRVWRLSGRLEALLALVGEVGVLADIGTDHALVPAHAVLRGICTRAYAVDRREDPLRVAANTVATLQVGARVTLLCGDGFLPLEGLEVDTVVLAGLSGRTMISLCSAAPQRIASLSRLIVQPNGSLSALRAWAHSAGLWLLDENICEEGGRFFVSCAFGPGQGPDPAYLRSELPLEAAFELGPWLLGRRDPLAAQSYEQERARLQDLVAIGREEHRARLSVFEAACRMFEGLLSVR